jgi:hypothetical protein
MCFLKRAFVLKNVQGGQKYRRRENNGFCKRHPVFVGHAHAPVPDRVIRPQTDQLIQPPSTYRIAN